MVMIVTKREGYLTQYKDMLKSNVVFGFDNFEKRKIPLGCENGKFNFT